MLTVLIGDSGFAHHEFQGAAFLVVDVGDAHIEAQGVAGMGHAVITEGFFAVQNARGDDAQFVTPGVRRNLELQREQKGRRQRQVGIPGIACGLFVKVNRVGFTGGLGEEAQLPGFGGHEESGQLSADVFLVDHLHGS
ncbi:hypothetical protein D3C86_1095530 [compost metagenome]